MQSVQVSRIFHVHNVLLSVGDDAIARVYRQPHRIEYPILAFGSVLGGCSRKVLKFAAGQPSLAHVRVPELRVRIVSTVDGSRHVVKMVVDLAFLYTLSALSHD